jgi:hypothetical protein
MTRSTSQAALDGALLSDGGAKGGKGGKGERAGSAFASSGWSQYKTLLGRELLSITRNPFDVAGRTLTFCWVGVVMGILYYAMPVGGAPSRGLFPRLTSWPAKGLEPSRRAAAAWAGAGRLKGGCGRPSRHACRLPHGPAPAEARTPDPRAPPLPSPPPLPLPRQFDADSARSRLNLVYMLLSFYCLMPYISMGLYTSDKKFYLADASSQLYRPLAYYLAKVRPGDRARPGRAPAACWRRHSSLCPVRASWRLAAAPPRPALCTRLLAPGRVRPGAGPRAARRPAPMAPAAPTLPPLPPAPRARRRCRRSRRSRSFPRAPSGSPSTAWAACAPGTRRS